MRLKPSRTTWRSPGSTNGKVTPEYTVSPQPKPKPSTSIRVTFDTLELASGSEEPRPTTTSSVSLRGTAVEAPSRAAWMRAPAARIMLRSTPSSRP